MGVRSFVAMLSVCSLFAVAGCSNDAQKVQPETRGQRGENCQARNDCASGLACLNHICSKNEFDVDVAVKQCDLIECETTKDCCGSKPSEAPAKCADRDALCTPTVPGCTVAVCTSDATCGGGTCRPGSCTYTATACEATADCQDTCSAAGTCTVSKGICTLDTDCSYYIYNANNTCGNRTCNCANPEYDPTATICSDPDCEGLCTRRCQDERCVLDTSCEDDTDCLVAGSRFCDDSRCVQCKEDEDCDEDGGETCDAGVCHKPCEHNEECPLFNACDADTGECEYVGCQSDRECILAVTGDGAGETPGPTAGGEDPRLLKCLPSATEEKIKECKIPCENDGSCGAQSVCADGYCKFIGCNDNEECRAYFGITNQKPTTEHPYVTTAVCRE